MMALAFAAAPAVSARASPARAHEARHASLPSRPPAAALALAVSSRRAALGQAAALLRPSAAAPLIARAGRTAGASRRGVVAVSCDGDMKVLVTGASGRTGSLVAQKLKEREGFKVLALSRSEKGDEKLKKLGLSPEEIVRGDATDVASLEKAMEGADALVVVTSAQPQIKVLSLLKVMVKKLLRQEGGRPEFKYPPEGLPEIVDWEGQKNQIDAAKAAGVKHVVVVGSMGGTQPAAENFLNTMGVNPDGSGGNILVWKRRSEIHLIRSGLTYTIIHPGGLVDKEGGKRQLVLDVDDALIGGPDGSKPENKTTDRTNRQVPRADVAEMCVQSLVVPALKNRAFDMVSKEEGDGAATMDFEALVETLSGRDCDYNINTPPGV